MTLFDKILLGIEAILLLIGISSFIISLISVESKLQQKRWYRMNETALCALLFIDTLYFNQSNPYEGIFLLIAFIAFMIGLSLADKEKKQKVFLKISETTFWISLTAAFVGKLLPL